MVRIESHSAMSSWPASSNALKGSCLTDWPAPVPVRLTHRTVQVISDGDLLCFRNKGSCRRSFDASSQSVAFGEYSTGLFILASTLSENGRGAMQKVPMRHRARHLGSTAETWVDRPCSR